ncbi:hypothetical protein [Bacillus sp. MUM 13]|uniref:hypothetical protein n=1 Tax=Bacillus sp. MUM 13 TaxID=1678001 RepID=UPI0008F56804|nr:hypothetical protein [Bacillus sp. MUM 13]OIK12480.1 hypothetical protein BIV59_08225 [Bacillus sp. MUM 13]
MRFLPLVLAHVTADAHVENDFQLWLLLVCNIFMVITGFIFIYKLFKQRTGRKLTIIFGISLLVNYVLVLIFGSAFDLLG